MSRTIKARFTVLSAAHTYHGGANVTLQAADDETAGSASIEFRHPDEADSFFVGQEVAVTFELATKPVVKAPAKPKAEDKAPAVPPAKKKAATPRKKKDTAPAVPASPATPPAA